MDLIKRFAITAIIPVLTACGASSQTDLSSGRVQTVQEFLTFRDPALDGAALGAGTVSSMALSVNIGSAILEAQIPPQVVNGTQLQSSQVAIAGTNAYVTYASVDNGGTVKKGAVERLAMFNCGPLALLGINEWCVNLGKSLQFPTTDLFPIVTDGTSLYVGGSTLDETYVNQYARVHKVTLDANKDPLAISLTQVLTSYVTTGLALAGTGLLTTTGTSTDVTKMGGLSLLNTSTLAVGASQSIYDARGVAVDPTNANQAFVVRGALDGSNPGAVLAYPTSAASTSTRTIATGGLNIPESHASVQVGNTLVLTSLGDQGLRVSCKATGASLATVPAPVVSGIPTSLTVTNAATAAPGWVFVANGEAGIYAYLFQKTSALNTSYCQGVTLTLVGRLSLSGSSTYVNGELSANTISYVPVLSVLGVVTDKLLVVASGNKGVSLINIGALSVTPTAVNDF